MELPDETIEIIGNDKSSQGFLLFCANRSIVVGQGIIKENIYFK